MSNIVKYFFIAIFGAFLVGCVPNKLDMVKPIASTAEERQLQTRSFDTNDTLNILSVSVATLQDLGFSIDEINRPFGVVTASKVRDAREVGQQVGLTLLAILALNANVLNAADHTQAIRASVVSINKQGKSIVRLVVQRVIYNAAGQVLKMEIVKDSEIYQAFFDKVSKSVFLEANQL